jgi:phage terminase large subunit-like protein
MYIPLHPVQLDFLDSPALYRAFIGGRGSGKSWVGCYDLIRKARPGRTYLLASPTYPMLYDSELRTFTGVARSLGVLAGVKASAPASARLVNGAEILMRSADDPERLRGPNLSGAVLMEAALMHRDAYDIAIACLREGGEQGWLTALTTPRGPSHWTYEVFATGRPNTVMFRAKTGDNPFNPPDFEKTLLDQYGDTNFARLELGGEFVQLEGAEFPGEWFGQDIWFDVWPDGLHLKVIALDPSKGSDGKGDDYQAHVLVGVAVEGGRYAYYVDADLQREGVVPMTERTVRLTRDFGQTGGRPVDSVVVEENGTLGLLPQAFDAACAKLGFPIPYVCRTNRDNKELRIRAWCGPPLSRRQLRFRRSPGGRMLVGQLMEFPAGERDDGPDALAVALRRVTELLQ